MVKSKIAGTLNLVRIMGRLGQKRNAGIGSGRRAIAPVHGVLPYRHLIGVEDDVEFYFHDNRRSRIGAGAADNIILKINDLRADQAIIIGLFVRPEIAGTDSGR